MNKYFSLFVGLENMGIHVYNDWKVWFSVNVPPPFFFILGRSGVPSALDSFQPGMLLYETDTHDLLKS
jgi:hypothetical protein